MPSDCSSGSSTGNVRRPPQEISSASRFARPGGGAPAERQQVGIAHCMDVGDLHQFERLDACDLEAAVAQEIGQPLVDFGGIGSGHGDSAGADRMQRLDDRAAHGGDRQPRGIGHGAQQLLVERLAAIERQGRAHERDRIGATAASSRAATATLSITAS